MNLLVNRLFLKNILEHISPCLSNAGKDVAQSHFLFTVSTNDCVVKAGNKESYGLMGQVHFDVSDTLVPLGETVQFTVGGSNLLGFLGDVEAGKVSITYNSTTRKVTITPEGKASKFIVTSFDPKMFADIHKDFATAWDIQARIPAQVLADSLSYTVDHTSDDKLQQSASLCRLKDGMMRSGTGRSLALFRHSQLEGDARIRFNQVAGIQNFLKRSGGTIQILQGDLYTYLRNEEGFYLGFSKVQFDVPNISIDSFFALEGDTIVTLDRAALKSALQRMKWVDSHLAKVGITVSGSDLSGRLNISAKNSVKNLDSSSDEELSCIREKGSETTTFFVEFTPLLTGLTGMRTDHVNLYMGNQKLKVISQESDPETGVTITRVLALGVSQRRD